MTELEARAAVVAEARTWMGTPYAHRQQLKGVGADCAQMPLAVYAACRVIPKTDVGAYAQQWFLHRGEEIYLDWVRRFACEIELAAASPGDFLVMRWGRTFSHGGIVVETWPLSIIHAFAKARRVTFDVVEQHEALRNRPMKLFSPWSVA